MNQFANLSLVAFLAGGCTTVVPAMNSTFQNYTLNYQTPIDPALQAQLEHLDSSLRAIHGMTTEQTGSTTKYANNWEIAFGKKSKAKRKAGARSAAINRRSKKSVASRKTARRKKRAK